MIRPILAALAGLAFAAPALAAPVHSALGGAILGYDIDAGGTRGVLAEYVPLGDGNNDVAVETFDQATGAILKIVKVQNDTLSDYVVLGVVGNGTGLVEMEHVSEMFVDKRTYRTIDPLSAGTFTGRWTPKMGKNDIIIGVSAGRGTTQSAVMAFRNGGDNHTFVFGTDVSADSFGPKIKIKDPLFDFNDSPAMTFDPVSNQAIVAASKGCPLDCPGRFALVDLGTGAIKFANVPGEGYINGIAVDSQDTMVCTATEIDFSAGFYNFTTHHGFKVTLPGATSQAQSGTTVEYDPANKLFLIAQPVSSTAASGSSIQLFDPAGNFVKSVNGLHLGTSPSRLAINPTTRTGFVQSSQDGGELQQFAY